MKNRHVKKFINYVLNGLVIMLPVFGTAYLMYKMFMFLDGIVPQLWYTEAELATRKGFSGWGIIVLLLLLFVMGWLGSLFINERLKDWFESLLNKIPGVNKMYHTISDILSAFVGNKKKFNQPVLVKMSDQLDLEMIGFITDTNLSELGDITGKVAVYFPMSYSFAGHLMIVPVKHIKRIERNSVDIMKYAVSGGIVELDHENEKQ
jgi:uncharacterized membrane protein